MANVTFWKGTLEAYQAKVTAGSLVEGRLYFIQDSENPTTMGALYLKDQLISPQRLTALTLDTTDNVNVATAKAIVDFVKAQVADIDADINGINAILAGFGTGEGQTATVAGAIATAKAEAIADADGKLANKVDTSAYNAQVASYDAILAGFGDGEGEVATVAGAIADVKAIASAAMEFKGVVADVAALEAITGMENGDLYYVTADDTEYVYIAAETRWEALGGYVKADVYTKAEINAFTVNGKSISTSPVLTGTDISVDASEGAVTVAAKLEELGEAIDAIKGGEGDEVTLEGLSARVSSVEGIVDGIGGTDEPATVVAAIATAKAEAIADADGKLANKVDTSVYTEKVNAIDAKDAAQDAILAGFGTEEGQTATVQGALDLKANAADVYAKSEVYTKEEADAAISAAALVWVED